MQARLENLDRSAILAALQMLLALLERLLHLQYRLDTGMFVRRRGDKGGGDGTEDAGAEQ
jgi:hypothetical protein